MLRDLKRLGSETAIYGTSTIVGRFLNFLLVPFYTNVLQPGDYGIVTYVYSLIAFVNVLYAYGMESAFFKYASTGELGSKRETFSTAWLSLLGTTVVFSIVLFFLTSPLGDLLNIPAQHSSILLFSTGMLAFDTLAIIPFAHLRMEHRAKQFALLKVINIALNVGMNVVLLVGFHGGLEGIFISGCTASVVTFLLLLPTVARMLRGGVKGTLLGALLRFGLPSIPAGLASMAVQVIDRPILRALTDDATVGIYQANYRLGIFMMLVVQMYDYAWRPFYFAVAQEKNAKELFARVLTYFLFLMAVAVLILTFFVGDLAKLSLFGRHLIHPSYWSGLPLVPIVLFGYLFLGIYTNVSAGIYIEKKTGTLPFITLLAAAVNVGANYLLIPSMGMIGAAWATFLAYAAMAAAGFVAAQRVYPIRYEWGRLGKIAAATAVAVAAYYVLGFGREGSLLSYTVKGGYLVLFLLLLAGMKFFRAGEVAYLKNAFARLRGGEKAVAEPPVDLT